MIRQLKLWEIKRCFHLINSLELHYKSGKQIAYETGFTRYEIRQYVKLIRREMVDRFQNPTGKYYIIANIKGYKMTKDIADLKKYLRSLTTRHNSLTAQIQQLKKVMENNGS